MFLSFFIRFWIVSLICNCYYLSWDSLWFINTLFSYWAVIFLLRWDAIILSSCYDYFWIESIFDYKNWYWLMLLALTSCIMKIKILEPIFLFRVYLLGLLRYNTIIWWFFFRLVEVSFYLFMFWYSWSFNEFNKSLYFGLY